MASSRLTTSVGSTSATACSNSLNSASVDGPSARPTLPETAPRAAPPEAPEPPEPTGPPAPTGLTGAPEPLGSPSPAGSADPVVDPASAEGDIPGRGGPPAPVGPAVARSRARRPRSARSRVPTRQ